jgi:hypothetical protein
MFSAVSCGTGEAWSLSLLRKQMMRHSIVAAALLVTGLAATPASACARHEELNLRSALSADLVVTGRIVNYRADAQRNELFDIAVGEVLRGRAGRLVTVNYSGRMLGPPSALPRGLVLAALQRTGDGYAIQWHMCSDPFLFPAASARGIETRRLLRQPGRR